MTNAIAYFQIISDCLSRTSSPLLLLHAASKVYIISQLQLSKPTRYVRDFGAAFRIWYGSKWV